MTGTDNTEKLDGLTRPIIGIENRTALEVFDIMSDRIRRAPAPAVQEGVVERLREDIERADKADLFALGRPYREHAADLRQVLDALAASPQPIEGEGKQEVMGGYRCSPTDTEASASPAARREDR